MRWVTNFEEKMAEITGVSGSKKGEYTMIIYLQCTVFVF